MTCPQILVSPERASHWAHGGEPERVRMNPGWGCGPSCPPGQRAMKPAVFQEGSAEGREPHCGLRRDLGPSPVQSPSGGSHQGDNSELSTRLNVVPSPGERGPPHYLRGGVRCLPAWGSSRAPLGAPAAPLCPEHPKHPPLATQGSKHCLWPADKPQAAGPSLRFPEAGL